MGDIMGNFMDFPDLINQIERLSMKRTYEFNLMLVGLDGMGKSTLVKSLFEDLIKPEQSSVSKINEYSDLLEKNGVKLKLRCLETSKFSHHKPNAYVECIESKLQQYFKDQLRHATWNIKDHRIHCCLYLIPPHGGLQLQQEDIQCMKALHNKVNLIPIIAKSDALSSVEKQKFKENILKDLDANGINYFRFQNYGKEDEERYRIIKAESEKFPFAVVAANEVVVDKKKKQWIRTSVFGQIDINDSTKCDFSALFGLFRHGMLDLIDSTNEVLYAEYKAQVMRQARETGMSNLRQMGLEPHEVERIEHKLYPDRRPATEPLEKKRAEMDRELQALRRRLETLKATLHGQA